MLRLKAQQFLVAGLAASEPLDLNLQGGEICCVIGPDDGGKTRWLRALAAVDRAGGGSLELAGINCSQLTPAQWRRLRSHVAYITAGTPLLSVIPGLANVLLAAQYHRLAPIRELETKAQKLLQWLQWEGPLDVLPAYLSRHQRQILTLARALMLDPELLFIDEPFHMSGASGWPQVSKILQDLAAGLGTTLVISTNHMEFVRRYADHLLFADDQGVRSIASWDALTKLNDPGVQEFLSSGNGS